MQNDPSQTPEEGNQPRAEELSPQEPEKNEVTPLYQAEEKRAPLPSWLRDELGEVSQEPAQQENVAPATQSESLGQAQEIAQLRAEVKQYRDEAARQRAYAQHARTYSAPPTRGGCLTAWLVFQSIAVALVILSTCLLASQGAPVVAFITVPFTILQAISINGLWNLRKWGYYMQMTLYSIGLAFTVLSICSISSRYSAYSFYASYSSVSVAPLVGSAVGAMIGMIILYLLVHDRWEIFE